MCPSQLKSKGNDNLKYKEAIRLFGETSLTRKEICLRCHLTIGAFSAHLQKYHRDLLFRKYGERDNNVATTSSLRIRAQCGQTVFSKKKYQKAIEACSNLNFITYSISDIARQFNLSPTGLGNQLRAHYPKILAWHYQEQRRRGIPTHQQKALKEEIGAQYTKAIAMLNHTNYSLKEVAERCRVSSSGLRQHVLFYHQDLVLQRRELREKNKGQKCRGKKTGSNTTHEPQTETVKKYAEALDLYSTTALSMKEIVERLNISYGGFYGYLRTWHRDLIIRRRGIKNKENVAIANLNIYKHYLVSTAAKYEKAITYMKNHEIYTTAAVARIFSLNPETFRKYLKEHEPKIAALHGMIITDDGRRVLRKTYEKYKRAIDLYNTTEDSLNDIVKMLHLQSGSFRSFLKRHHMEHMGYKQMEKRDFSLVSNETLPKKGNVSLENSDFNYD